MRRKWVEVGGSDFRYFQGLPFWEWKSDLCVAQHLTRLLPLFHLAVGPVWPLDDQPCLENRLNEPMHCAL